MKEQKLPVAIAITLLGLCVLARLLPHPANFAPVAAIAIFGGAILPRKVALWVPLAAMVLSDLVIGFYRIMPIVWACYLAIALASMYWLHGKPTVAKGAALVAASSTFFFMVTNFAVWMFDGIYPHTLPGLAQCYQMALPFFRNTVLSDALYTAGLFGIYTLASRTANQYVLGAKEI